MKSPKETARHTGQQSAPEKTNAATISAQQTTVSAIPAHFTCDGFAFRLLKRAGDVALFEKRKPTHRHESFEVVIIQKHPAEKIYGREYPARESMPPSEAWGTFGWTHTELEEAKRKFCALVESRQEGHFQPADTVKGAFSSAESTGTGETRP